MNKVKVFGTLGPACSKRETLIEMFREGMDGMRLNLSHTTLKEAAALIEAYHSAARFCGIDAELLIDLQGPELRIGDIEPMELTAGSLIDLQSIPFPQTVIDTLAAAENGAEVLIDDGKMLLKAEKSLTGCLLRVVRGGVLTLRKSVALPGYSINTPALTEYDKQQLSMAKEFGVTGIMQPFVRGKDDLEEVRSEMELHGCGGMKLFAKIENAVGVNKLVELLPCCDEIVIARGDLGNSMELWQLPAVQKHVSTVCRAAGHRFTVVTQMLDSMIDRPVPTRAEVSDIFNAVLDGASSVMLTGETASGKYPVQAIRYMAKTVREAEAFIARPDD